ncbi:MAG: hypothetical protein WJ307_01210 [Ferrovum myxofaciens]
MSQHFLLSAKARTLSVLKVMQMNDADAFTVFKEFVSVSAFDKAWEKIRNDRYDKTTIACLSGCFPRWMML